MSGGFAMQVNPVPAHGPERPVYAPAQHQRAPAVAAPTGEGRAIAGFVLAIIGVLSTPVAFGAVSLLGLMITADAWEDIQRDPDHKGRKLAIAAFWIVGLTFALGLLVVLGVAIAG